MYVVLKREMMVSESVSSTVVCFALRSCRRHEERAARRSIGGCLGGVDLQALRPERGRQAGPQSWHLPVRPRSLWGQLSPVLVSFAVLSVGRMRVKVVGRNGRTIDVRRQPRAARRPIDPRLRQITPGLRRLCGQSSEARSGQG